MGVRTPTPPPSPTPSRRQLLLVASAAAVAVAAGCSPDKGTVATASPTASPSATKKPKPKPKPDPKWPLTGKSGKITKRPALSVKIENTAAARPQTGLNSADVVYEEMVEGGITRYSAVFHSRIPKVVGPVRSVRPMDPAIAAPYGGAMVFSGGQPPFVHALSDAGLQLVADDLGAKNFFRSSDRRAPHNLYANLRTISKEVDKDHAKPPSPQLKFAKNAKSATASGSGKTVGRVDISFPSSRPSWVWQEAKDRWLRLESGEKDVTTDAGRIRATNIVVARVTVKNTSYLDPAGNPVPDTVLSGSGKAQVFTGGRVIDATWHKKATRDKLELKVAGKDVRLAPGNTWIELVPISGSSVKVS